jgi:hypothetical protein
MLWGSRDNLVSPFDIEFVARSHRSGPAAARYSCRGWVASAPRDKPPLLARFLSHLRELNQQEPP